MKRRCFLSLPTYLYWYPFEDYSQWTFYKHTVPAICRTQCVSITNTKNIISYITIVLLFLRAVSNRSSKTTASLQKEILSFVATILLHPSLMTCHKNTFCFVYKQTLSCLPDRSVVLAKQSLRLVVSCILNYQFFYHLTDGIQILDLGSCCSQKDLGAGMFSRNFLHGFIVKFSTGSDLRR